MKNTNKKKTMAVVAAIALVIIIIIIILLLKGCENKAASNKEQTDPTVLPTVATVATDDEAAVQDSTTSTDPTSASEYVSTKPAESGTENLKPSEAEATTSTTQPQASAGSNTTPTTAPAAQKPTTAPSAQKPTTAPAQKPTTAPAPAPTVKATEKPSDPHEGKTYHEAVYKTVHHDAVYENVYVVDQEAYTYEEPIYEERQITVCHVCRAEFDTSYSTAEFNAHIKAHALAGEGGAYHSEVRKIQVDSKTITVPEIGHTEKKLVRAAYDEKVLVKEAGWY